VFFAQMIGILSLLRCLQSGHHLKLKMIFTKLFTESMIPSEIRLRTEGEMAQGRQRQPFKMPFTFSLNNILSVIADHLSKKSTFGDLPISEATSLWDEVSPIWMRSYPKQTG
jgi:hypothetical protein